MAAEKSSVSHPLRIRILEVLSANPMGFEELREKLGIETTMELENHLKELTGLVTVDAYGNLVLTGKGYAALDMILAKKVARIYLRSYLVNFIIYLLLNIYTYFFMNEYWLPVVFPITTVWLLFYTYWAIIRRRIFRPM